MKDFIKVMKAPSDPNRVKILKLLQQKTMCVCELQGALQISQPSVLGTTKTIAFVSLVVVMATISGMIFGRFFAWSIGLGARGLALKIV